MKNANLLIPCQAFEWTDSNLSDAIDNFIIAFDKARADKDAIFNSEHTFELEQYLTICDWQNAKKKYSWLSQVHQQFIITQLFNFSLTKDKSNSLPDLDREFNYGNNALFSIDVHTNCNRNVHNLHSWHTLHINYLTSNPSYISWGKNDFLPNCQFSDTIICEFVKTYKPDILNDNERLSTFEVELVKEMRKNNKGPLIDLAAKIAKANYYRLDDNLSNAEQQRCGSERRIFKITKNNEAQYLSLDHENFLFEVCDRQGRHCGAINFSGKIKEKVQPDHSIIIK